MWKQLLNFFINKLSSLDVSKYISFIPKLNLQTDIITKSLVSCGIISTSEFYMGSKTTKNKILTPIPNNGFHTTSIISNKIPPRIRNGVWSRYHNEKISGHCYCCNTKVQRYNNGWHCSHVIARNKGGETTVDNMRPCCSTCNLSMGDQNLYVYIRNKKLKGPGALNMIKYLKDHPDQKDDTRTNTWKKK